MDVARITYRGAFGGAGELDLPERGVVLVVGPNGAGKSSFVEAVAVAAWGRTLRDARPWRAGEATALHLVARPGLTVLRSRTARGAQKLRFSRVGADEQESVYETATKAQAALDVEVGPFDLWRRANVFSGADAAHLSLATDAERKRLFEAMLGLSAFDDAVEACKRDVADAQREEVLHGAAASTARQAAQRAEEEVARALRAWVNLKEGLPPVPPSELAEELAVAWALGGERAASARLAESEAALVALSEAFAADAAAWQREASRVFSAAAGLAARARLEAARLARIEGGVCGECEQAVPATTHVALAAEVARLRARAGSLEARARDYDAEFTATRAEERAVAVALRDLHDRGVSVLRDLRDRDAWETELAAAADLVADLTDRAASSKLAAAQLGEREREAARALAELRAVADVLGLRGPRTTVLAGALGGITAGANDWLRRLGGGIQVELRPYTETRSGGTTGAIEVKVHGAGGGEGYKACSSGERRRVDVALLFGVGEVASAARGGRKSTMWCDEVLTHLDEAGVAGAVAAIHDVARERCVVVMEQERNVAVEMLRPDRVVRLKRG